MIKMIIKGKKKSWNVRIDKIEIFNPSEKEIKKYFKEYYSPKNGNKIYLVNVKENSYVKLDPQKIRNLSNLKWRKMKKSMFGEVNI